MVITRLSLSLCARAVGFKSMLPLYWFLLSRISQKPAVTERIFYIPYHQYTFRNIPLDNYVKWQLEAATTSSL